MMTVIYKGKPRPIKCECNHDWAKDDKLDLEDKKVKILFIERNTQEAKENCENPLFCEKCGYYPWITVGRRL